MSRCLVGFTTYTGTVTAASEWGGPAERKHLRRALPGSWEELLHEQGVPAFLLDDSRAHGRGQGSVEAAGCRRATTVTTSNMFTVTLKFPTRRVSSQSPTARTTRLSGARILSLYARDRSVVFRGSRRVVTDPKPASSSIRVRSWRVKKKLWWRGVSRCQRRPEMRARGAPASPVDSARTPPGRSTAKAFRTSAAGS